MRTKNTIAIIIVLALVLAFFPIIGASNVQAQSNRPTKIKTVKVSNIKTTSAKISFSKSKYAKRYQVAYKKKGTTKWKYKITKNRYTTLKSLTMGKKYGVKIRGLKKTTVNSNYRYQSKWSKIKYFYTKYKYKKPQYVYNVYIANNTDGNGNIQVKEVSKAVIGFKTITKTIKPNQALKVTKETLPVVSGLKEGTFTTTETVMCNITVCNSCQRGWVLGTSAVPPSTWKNPRTGITHPISTSQSDYNMHPSRYPSHLSYSTYASAVPCTLKSTVKKEYYSNVKYKKVVVKCVVK